MLRHFPGAAVFFSSAAVRSFQIAMPPTAWANVIFLHKSLLLFFRYLDYIIAERKLSRYLILFLSGNIHSPALLV
jgi:hypothetical protein